MKPPSRARRPGAPGIVVLALLAASLRVPLALGAPSAFDPASPHEIHLRFTAAEWNALEPIETGASPSPMGPPGMAAREYPWSTVRFEGSGVSLTNVAIRFKGNSSYAMSRHGWKRPFRIDFNRGARGRTWLGAEELALNNNVNDATQFREALAYEVCREAGVPSPRTGFAVVRISVEGQVDGLVAGAYTLVETVENDFLQARFGRSKGLLLKPERLRGLEYLGEDWPAYRPRYDPKSEPTTDEARRFMALTRLVAEADDTTFARELGLRLDVPAFLRFVAVVAWLANYDSFVGNGHNYYLFQPRDGAAAVFIPWDQNEAFGGHPGVGPRRLQAEFSILRPWAAPNRLIERILAHPDWNAAYRREVERLQDSVCSTERLVARASQLAAFVEPGVKRESMAAWRAFRAAVHGDMNLEQERSGPDLPVPGRFLPGSPVHGRGEDGTLSAWIVRRWENVAAELAGTRTPTIPSLGRGPGVPGGPGPGRMRIPGEGPPRGRPDPGPGPRRARPEVPGAPE